MPNLVSVKIPPFGLVSKKIIACINIMDVEGKQKKHERPIDC